MSRTKLIFPAMVVLAAVGSGRALHAAPRAWIEPCGPSCVRVVVSVDAPVRGGELGIAYDAPGVSVVPEGVAAGAGFPEGAELRVETDVAAAACPGSAPPARGLVVAWGALQGSAEDVILPPGQHELLIIELAGGGQNGGCSPLRFSSCLGRREAPVRNIVTDLRARSVTLITEDGEPCPDEGPAFIRGDANADGFPNITDAILILNWLFSGGEAPACMEAADVDGKGTVEITDPIALLGHLFSGGLPPADPYPECGAVAPPMAATLGCEQTPERCR
jgi:hypothetical protein